MTLIGPWLKRVHQIDFRSIAPRIGLLCSVIFLTFGCETIQFSESNQDYRNKNKLVLKRSTYDHLEGWRLDNHLEALKMFTLSCNAFMGSPEKVPFHEVDGKANSVWEQVCRKKGVTELNSNLEARIFFEKWFQPYAVYYGDSQNGLFTGYFEPELSGSLEPNKEFWYPLYGRPNDLIEASLGKFSTKYNKEHIVGRVIKGALQPYPSRTEIEKGVLQGQGLELVWVNNSIDAFFLHIQGSGKVRFQDGSYRRLSYAGNNGHPYYAIGRSLVARDIFSIDQINMDSIHRWLEANPLQAQEVMQENPRFIFFKWLSEGHEDRGPIGAQGVQLTAGRSIAVDLRYLPLGVPLWVETSVPTLENNKENRFHRLMIAQDTGEAIRGIVRGDIFLGSGQNAGSIAGRMKHDGQYWLLLPRKLDVGVLVN